MPDDDRFFCQGDELHEYPGSFVRALLHAVDKGVYLVEIGASVTLHRATEVSEEVAELCARLSRADAIAGAGAELLRAQSAEIDVLRREVEELRRLVALPAAAR